MVAAERRATRARPPLPRSMTAFVSRVACMRLLWCSAEMPPHAPGHEGAKGRRENTAAHAPREYLSTSAARNGAEAAIISSEPGAEA
jgi:hypothetical protein